MNRASARRFLNSYFEAPAVRLLAALGFTPNAITLSGLLVAGGGALAIGRGWLAFGGILLVLAGAFDLLDGALARHSGKESRFGALLDSTTDRVSEAAVLLGLLVFYMTRSSTLGVVLVYVALFGSVMVSYVRARAEGLGVECKVGVMTRSERVALMVAALMVGQWWQPALMVALVVIAALTTITTVQRVLHVKRVMARDGSPAGGGHTESYEDGGFRGGNHRS